MTDYNDALVKEAIIEKLLEGREVGYRKLFLESDMLALFKFLSIDGETDGNLFQKTLYDFLYEPTIAEKKCNNPNCNNESNFDRFKYHGKLVGYKPYCSKHCSSVTQPRGWSSSAHKKQIADAAQAKQNQRDQETADTIASGKAVCFYCGAPAVARGGKKDVYRCNTRVQECPVVKNNVGNGVSNATKGVSRKETAELLVTEIERLCDYGCCGVAMYKLNGQNGVKFSCSPAYQSCDGARKYRSSFMTKKYENPAAKKQFLDRMCNTKLLIYGVAWSAQMADFKAKYGASLEEKYGKGVTHNSLIPGYREFNIQRLLNLNTYTRKPYTWPSGKVTMVQGYEDIALDQILETYTEDQIITGSENVPTILYTMLEREHWYYPDIYIPSENLILEVKSPYTYLKDLEQNKIKEQHVLDAGYNFGWLIYDDRNHKNVLNEKDLIQTELKKAA